MSVRRVIHRFLAAFGIVVAVSFAYGGYLTRVRRTASKESILLTSTDETIESLLRSGALYLDSKQVEQALIAYRKALTVAPKSIDAQLGVARGELMAGRESVAAREYERILLLDHDNAIGLQQLARIYSHQRETWGHRATAPPRPPAAGAPPAGAAPRAGAPPAAAAPRGGAPGAGALGNAALICSSVLPSFTIAAILLRRSVVAASF